MTTLREFCRVLTTALHIPNVERWAEQLINRGLLPGLDNKVCTLDAAVVLAAVAVAPNPEDAPHAVVTLANLPRMFAMRRVDGPEIETWARGTDADIAAMPYDPLDALAVAIEQGPFPDNRFYFGSLKIEGGGVRAELLGHLGDDLQACRAQFYLPDSGLPSGLTRTAEIHGDVILAISNAMWPAAERVVHDESTLIVH